MNRLVPRAQLIFNMNEAITFINNPDTPNHLRAKVRGILERNLDTIDKNSRVHAALLIHHLKKNGIQFIDNHIILEGYD